MVGLRKRLERLLLYINLSAIDLSGYENLEKLGIPNNSYLSRADKKPELLAGFEILNLMFDLSILILTKLSSFHYLSPRLSCSHKSNYIHL